MSDQTGSAGVVLKYTVSPDDFTRAGEASSKVKNILKQMGISPDVMYEGDINMVIHAHGGEITVTITPQEVLMELKDVGPGIEDVEKAMKAGYSTAPEQVRALGFGAGMGLPNMQGCTDEMKVETELGVGTTITMSVHMENK